MLFPLGFYNAIGRFQRLRLLYENFIPFGAQWLVTLFTSAVSARSQSSSEHGTLCAKSEEAMGSHARNSGRAAIRPFFMTSARPRRGETVRPNPAKPRRGALPLNISQRADWELLA
jgi:hypothetical protein